MPPRFAGRDYRLTRTLASEGRFDSFDLVEITTDSAPSPAWDAFGPRLRAHRATLRAGYVGRLFPRSSAVLAAEILGESAPDQTPSDDRSLSSIAPDLDLSSIDFLNLAVKEQNGRLLLGSREQLNWQRLLGVAVEVSCSGDRFEGAAELSGTDLFLRAQGYSLFDLNPQRYTRAALPGKFRRNVPQQTIRGQASWADALYLRDFADPRFPALWPECAPNGEQLLKAAALFELFDLHDCAVELLDVLAEKLGADAVRRFRDVLVEESTGTTDYDAYLRRFGDYASTRRFQLFPDDYTIVAEGFAVMRHGDPQTATFRQL